jgi:hypothetical protein
MIAPIVGPLLEADYPQAKWERVWSTRVGDQKSIHKVGNVDRSAQRKKLQQTLDQVYSSIVVGGEKPRH